MRLYEIRESVQQIAEAVSAALKMEVEIADENLSRVAGTGKAQVNILRTMAGEDHVYQSALRTGEPVIIRNPGFNEICKPCIHYGNCPETGEICCPIQMDGKGVGVIGLLAFDADQRNRLFEDVEVIMNFLKKMADLIASKLKEHKIYQDQQAAVKQLTTVMDYLDQGVIAVDQNRRIIHMNIQAKQLLQINGLEEVTAEIKNDLLGITEQPDDQSVSREIHMVVKGESKEFWVSMTPININKKKMGAVITIDDMEKMASLVMKFQDKDGSDPFISIIGTSQAIIATKEKARKVANSDSTILIQGESGTGKELFARAIHSASHRSKKMFLSINCGAIPEHLLESELFGYEEGAFTGARKGGKAGKFELADGGTLFLDEIGDMPLHLQVKLLRVLQEKQIERVGSVKGATPIDVRVIAATHRNLEKLIQQGQFREDLYYRLNVIPLYIPPLRERKEDILMVANHFLNYYAGVMRKPIKGIQAEAKHTLIGFSWPGNVRELANAMEYAVNMESSSEITIDNLPQKVNENRKFSPYPFSSEIHAFRELNLRELERKAICHALEIVNKSHDRKERAAELLGISRATLFRKIKEYEIEI